MKGKIIKSTIARLQPGEALWDTEIKGFVARKLPSGTISYALQYVWRGRKRWQRIATSREIGPTRAREIAKGIVGDIAHKVDPRPGREASLRFDKIVDTFIERHAKRNNRESWADEVERIFAVYVTPSWGARPIHEITRRDVADLLDRIEDRRIKNKEGRSLGGPVMADRALAAVRKLFRWYAARDDSFTPPIVPGMARTKPRERARSRVLSDVEIRTIWPVLDGLGTYGALVKLLFMTAQRRGEVAGLHRSEIDAEGVWTIPPERSKTGRANFVPLPEAAREIIAAQPVINESDLVFTTDGEVPFDGFSKCRRRLDAAVLAAMRKRVEEAGEDADEVEPLPRWTLHDIRRSAKTLMTRAGVRPDISERVLGHVIQGVEGTYDRHDYLEEKRAALDALALMIERIVNPIEGNVVELRADATPAGASADVQGAITTEQRSKR